MVSSYSIFPVSADKEELRKRIEQQTREFLRKGGEIHRVESGEVEFKARFNHRIEGISHGEK